MPLSPDALQALLQDPQELALLDVREARQALGPHLALARHAALSGLELQLPDFVPRRDTPVVLYDEDDREGGAAARAQALLLRLGWTDVRRLRGGLAAWVAQGRATIDGYGALIKSFGDLARQHYRTPTLSPDGLEARLREGRPTTLIDIRPGSEYAFLSIAGARNYPGTEAALRRLAAAEPDRLWAVNCFSRTRGIIGATTLRLLGAPSVAFVEDGVMAWGLRGSPVVQNARATDDIPQDTPAALRQRADALVQKYGLARVDGAALERFQADPARSTYLFDLRLDGPVAAGARRVAAGQLLMHFENLVGTRGARVVLIDEPHGLRAAITAFWLAQFNQAEPLVLDGTPPEASASAPSNPSDRRALDIPALTRLIEAGRATLVDIAPSAEYEQGHLPGAFFLLPSSLQPADRLLSSPATVVFTSSDGRAARLAARDAQARAPAASVAWLQGGTTAWKQAGHALETSWQPAQLLTPFDDDYGSVMRIAGPGRDAAWRDYLRWERGVAARILQDPAVRFRFFA
ncbi:rhodanese [Xylophilus rhododendri]|uniref:Rhodanese n=1 Tax=Xylophilus rhododendri TaxID=2697032 RepID=A0A857J9V3_9BURK|nr:rhodanese-like domain-containing protein [Xylophilus rhododendri]QHI99901.1 rhodanese [Xylophilus rhododendri]